MQQQIVRVRTRKHYNNGVHFGWPDGCQRDNETLPSLVSLISSSVEVAG